MHCSTPAITCSALGLGLGLTVRYSAVLDSSDHPLSPCPLGPRVDDKLTPVHARVGVRVNRAITLRWGWG